jgi:hypothetical protein
MAVIVIRTVSVSVTLPPGLSPGRARVTSVLVLTPGFDWPALLTSYAID